MTKKDYELIAETFSLTVQNKELTTKEKGLLYVLASNLCDRLYQDNPRFSRNTFMEACGLEPMREFCGMCDRPNDTNYSLCSKC